MQPIDHLYENARKSRTFLTSKLHHVFRFLLSQGIAMLGNLLYGFLCVRLLAVAEYARFAVLFGFMGSLSVLLDVGLSATLIPLIGDRVANRSLVANYVATLRALSQKVYLCALPLALIVFVAVVKNQPWQWYEVAEMMLVLAIAGWFARVGGCYGSVLILLGKRNEFYRTQLLGSLGALLALLLIIAMHRLTLFSAILFNVLQIIVQAMLNYWRALSYMGSAGQREPAIERQMLRLALPNIPTTIFYALQGQFSLVAILLFGSGVRSVANIGALSRLGQVFALFGQMNPILVEPLFARLAANRVARLLLLGILVVGSFGTIVSLSAYVVPQAFLWILGPKYHSLRIEAGLMVTGSAIRLLGGFIWMVNSSRRFVYWWNNLLMIGAMLTVQALFVARFDIGEVRVVLWLNIASASVEIGVHVATSLYGLIRGPREESTDVTL